MIFLIDCFLPASREIIQTATSLAVLAFYLIRIRSLRRLGKGPEPGNPAKIECRGSFLSFEEPDD